MHETRTKCTIKLMEYLSWPSINCLTWTCRLNNANFWDKNYLYRYTPIFPVKRNKKEMINVCTRSTIPKIKDYDINRA